MSKFLLCWITFLLLMVSGALSQDVHYDFDKTADFSKFKTYKWITLKSVAPIDKLTDEQIKAALDTALAQKGFKKVDGDSTADLLIGYQTSELIDEEFSHIDASHRMIYSGDLAVDMYDPANHHPIWRGIASKALDPKAKPEKRQKNLDRAVAKLMKNYPPPVSK
jgi:hypothetical protein